MGEALLFMKLFHLRTVLRVSYFCANAFSWFACRSAFCSFFRHSCDVHRGRGQHPEGWRPATPRLYCGARLRLLPPAPGPGPLGPFPFFLSDSALHLMSRHTSEFSGGAHLGYCF